MEINVTRRYHFEAGHWLPKVRPGHRCARKHGHNYFLDVTVAGPVDEAGFIIDFWDLDDLVQPLLDLVDHQMLNEVEGLENPTAENIAVWFFDRLKEHGAVVIKVYETRDCWATAMR